jgi:hypothetical protein
MRNPSTEFNLLLTSMLIRFSSLFLFSNKHELCQNFERFVRYPSIGILLLIMELRQTHVTLLKMNCRTLSPWSLSNSEIVDLFQSLSLGLINDAISIVQVT